MKAIIILHGYSGYVSAMKPMAKVFESSGYFDQVLTLRLYDSIWGIIQKKYSIVTPIVNISDAGVDIKDSIVENVLQQLRSKLDPEINELHLLGYSLGGLVWRAFLKAVVNDNSWLFDDNSPTIKSLVTLASPYYGVDSSYMRLAGIVHRIHNTFFNPIVSGSFQASGKIAVKSASNEEQIDIIANKPHTQLSQMLPDSPFMQWLSAAPVPKIPHYSVIGSCNTFQFTDMEFRKPHINEYRQRQINDIIDNTEDLTLLSENKVERLSEFTDSIISNSTVDIIALDLADHASKINHFNIYMWHLPDPAIQYVKNLILDLYSRL